MQEGSECAAADGSYSRLIASMLDVQTEMQSALESRKLPGEYGWVHERRGIAGGAHAPLLDVLHLLELNNSPSDGSCGFCILIQLEVAEGGTRMEPMHD